MKTTSRPQSKTPTALQRTVYIIRSLLFITFLAGSILHPQAETERDAQRHFQEGRYEDALKIYRRLALENPDTSRFAYNAGAAAYKAEQLEEAVKQFDAAALSSNLELQQKAHYNLGNSFFRSGEAAAELEQKAAAWKQAIQRYQHALRLDETDTLTQENLDFVKRRLEELQQQQQQNPEQNQSNKNENQESSEPNQNPEDAPQQNNEPQQLPESSANRNPEQNEEKQPQPNQPEQKNTDSQTPQSSETQPNEKNSAATPQPAPGKMTPEQARQLLDAERDKAQAMIFRPPQNPQPRSRSFKDW